ARSKETGAREGAWLVPNPPGLIGSFCRPCRTDVRQLEDRFSRQPSPPAGTRARGGEVLHVWSPPPKLSLNCGLEMMGMLAVLHLRDGGGTQRQKLDEILGEHQIQGPIHHDTALLFESWQLAQVNSPPQPPGDEAGEVHAKDSGHARALANRGQLS